MGKKFAIVLAAMVISSAGVAVRVSDAANYALDGSHTSVVFAVSHLGFSYTYGRFNEVTGTFAFDSSDPTASRFAIDMNTGSVDTNDAKRDQHLKGPDFFNAKQFPKIQFRSTSLASKGDSLELTGELTLHGVTKEITIPLKFLGEGKGPTGKEHAGFMSQFSLKRSDFGMTNMVGPIGDEVSVLMSFEGVRQ
jgi:polyisoprenoid-binding protein YceI